MLKQNSTKRNFLLLTLIGMAAIATPVLGAAPDDKATSATAINAANKLLRDGEIDGAIERYAGIVAEEEHRDQLNFNLGVGHYRKGEIEAARQLFEKVSGSANASLAASGRYNLGNCHFAVALQTAESDKAAAIEQLRNAIAHYRGSLRTSAGNEDARANIELAAELIRRLEAELNQQQQEQQQQEQQQQEQQQDQQQQDQQQQDQQQQDQGQQGENQKDSSQQPQDSSSQDQAEDSQQQNQNSEQNSSESSQADDSKDSASERSDSSKSENKNAQSSESEDEEQQNSDEEKSEASETKEEKQDSQDQQSESQSADAGDANDAPSENEPQKAEHANPAAPGERSNNQQQSQAGKQASQEDAQEPNSEDDNQEVSAGELTAADPSKQGQQPTGVATMSDPNATKGMMTQEEALKMLQAVRDRDMLRRLRMQQRERARHVPVDRDW